MACVHPCIGITFVGISPHGRYWCMSYDIHRVTETWTWLFWSLSHEPPFRFFDKPIQYNLQELKAYVKASEVGDEEGILFPDALRKM